MRVDIDANATKYHKVDSLSSMDITWKQYEKSELVHWPYIFSNTRQIKIASVLGRGMCSFNVIRFTTHHTYCET